MITPSKILFYICVSFVLGIFISSMIKVPQLFVLGFLFIAIFIIITSTILKKNNLAVIGFCIIFLVIGVLRFQISEFNIANDKLGKFIGKGNVVLTGIISDGPDVRETSQKITVRVNNSLVLITTDKYVDYKYLDTVKIIGKLEAPMVTDDFNYKDYLLKDHIYSVMYLPKIELVSEKHQYNIFSYSYEKILFFKQKLDQSIQDDFLPPRSLLLEGIILGNNKNMTQDLRDKLNATGLRFLTAISGVHVVILSAILISLLLFLGLRRNSAFYLSIIFVWLYVVITGFSASGIRASIMGSIFIFASAFGRQNTSSRTIVLAGALMLLQNPLLLIYDIGFQLSFMASLGIIFLKPAISGLLKTLFKDKFNELLDIISITITAQIFTIPIMVYNFGNMSLVAPITNILILPIMPWILSFGFIFSILGTFSKILGWIFSIPCWFLITYFFKVMEIFSQPWMAKTVTNIHWVWLLISYFIIGVATRLLNKKYNRGFL